MDGFDQLGQALAHLALALPRVGAALLIVPLLAQETVPALVRNVFILGIALTVYPFVAHEIAPGTIGGAMLLPLLAKELLLGALIGFSFGIAFWALASAGDVIDNKIGAVAAQAADPMSGNSHAEFGRLMARLAGYLFVAFGGVRVFLDLVLSSYQIWPLASAWPALQPAGAAFVIERSGDLLRLALLLSAPAWVLMTLLDVALGLVNRYAQQLNVYALSMSIKSWLAVLVVVLMAGTIAETLAGWIGAQQQGLLDALRSAVPAPPR
jgi:type III secretion protein T